MTALCDTGDCFLPHHTYRQTLLGGERRQNPQRCEDCTGGAQSFGDGAKDQAAARSGLAQVQAYSTSRAIASVRLGRLSRRGLTLARSLIYLDFGNAVKLLLDSLGIFLADILFQRLRCAIDQILGFLQAQRGDLTHSLDRVDLVCSGILQDNGEFGLLWSSFGGRARSAAGNGPAVFRTAGRSACFLPVAWLAVHVRWPVSDVLRPAPRLLGCAAELHARLPRATLLRAPCGAPSATLRPEPRWKRLPSAMRALPTPRPTRQNPRSLRPWQLPLRLQAPYLQPRQP